MTALTLERNLRALPETTPPVAWHDRPDRVSLRTDLYLLAHDDDTGQPHLDKPTIAAGLAAAVLLELWHTGRVHLARRENTRHGRRNHGQITLIDISATGDPINDTALTLLWRMGGTADTHQFIEAFATTNLYEQVRNHLVTSGILRTVTRRRYWLFRTKIRRPARATYPVRARMRIRDVARLYKPHPHDTTLAALVTALRLTRYVYLTDHSVSGLHLRLAELLGPQHPIHDITNAIRPHRVAHP